MLAAHAVVLFSFLYFLIALKTKDMGKAESIRVYTAHRIFYNALVIRQIVHTGFERARRPSSYDLQIPYWLFT